MRLIDADALKDWLTKQTGFRANCEDCIDNDCIDCIIKEAIDNAPTIPLLMQQNALTIKYGGMAELADATDLSIEYLQKYR